MVCFNPPPNWTEMDKFDVNFLILVQRFCITEVFSAKDQPTISQLHKHALHHRYKTRWSPHTSSLKCVCVGGGEGGSGPDQLKPKCHNLSKAGLLWVGGWVGVGPDQLNPKCQDLSKSAFWGGGGGFRLTFLKYLSGGTQGILNQKFWQLVCVVHDR